MAASLNMLQLWKGKQYPTTYPEKEGRVNSGMQDSGEISSEKWIAILVACLLEICIPKGTGEEKSEQMMPGAGRLPAFMERLRGAGFYSQQSEGWERLYFLSISVPGCKNQKKRKLLKLKDNCIPRTSGYKLTIKEFSLVIRRKILAIRATRFRNSL